jgi:glycosyltransferase involved in cell wall biosynthesis
MYPHPDRLQGDPRTGIAQVIVNWQRHLRDYDIEIAPEGEEGLFTVGHAAARPGAEVNYSHGLLWTGEFTQLGDAASQVNAALVDAARKAYAIAAPSEWVANVYRRDMRKQVTVLGHGINWQEWQGKVERGNYVLWAKNRDTDGLNPDAVRALAERFPKTQFITTFGDVRLPNVKHLGGSVPFEEMKKLVRSAGVLLMSDRETWGIAAAEAMAAGVPVLSTKAGAVGEFMPHGVAGYLFEPSLDDAMQGLDWCLRYRDILGENGRAIARELDWKKRIKPIADFLWSVAYGITDQPLPLVDVIIPCHNYGDKIGRAIESCLAQTWPVNRVIAVNDKSTDNTQEILEEWARKDVRVTNFNTQFGNVALARNYGILQSKAQFVIPLDADDWLERNYVALCIQPLLQDPSLGFSYTGVRVILPDGRELVPPHLARDGETAGRDWPTERFDEQFMGANQIPSATMIRRSAFDAVGGYRPRYCPDGAGSEDAEMYLRLLAYGYWGKMVQPERKGLWVHTHGDGHVSGREGYEEVDWTAWHPWCHDYKFPFAAAATPRSGAHKIYSYEPKISVIIPVGPYHIQELTEALDSLEAQTFREWEVIVVWDCQPTEGQKSFYETAYPYVRNIWLKEPGVGPGRARNLGVRESKASYICFLDADDYLAPQYLERVWEGVLENPSAVVYTDKIMRIRPKDMEYVGGEKIRESGGYWFVKHKVKGYDRRKAFAKPTGPVPYVWTGINVVLPKALHESIWFDETMPTWEDCDYMLRLAWQGAEFEFIEEQLWVYNYATGQRRNVSTTISDDMIAVLQKKWDELVGEKQWAVDARRQQ